MVKIPTPLPRWKLASPLVLAELACVGSWHPPLHSPSCCSQLPRGGTLFSRPVVTPGASPACRGRSQSPPIPAEPSPIPLPANLPCASGASLWAEALTPQSTTGPGFLVFTSKIFFGSGDPFPRFQIAESHSALFYRNGPGLHPLSGKFYYEAIRFVKIPFFAHV